MTFAMGAVLSTLIAYVLSHRSISGSSPGEAPSLNKRFSGKVHSQGGPAAIGGEFDGQGVGNIFRCFSDDGTPLLKAEETEKEAARLCSLLAQKNPVLAGELGQALTTLMTETGDYLAAVEFALADVSPNRLAWLTSVFYQWAVKSPEIALRSLGCISDPVTRRAAFEGLVCGWAETDPAGVASSIQCFSLEEDRASAISHFMPFWIIQDQAAALDWISRAAVSREMDGGIAAVSTLPSIVSKDPEMAVNLASTIYDPILRANTFSILSESWAQNDPTELRRYMDSNPTLEPADLIALADGLSSLPDS